MMSTLQFAVINFLFFTATQGTRQVTLTCGDDENLGERGLPGAPGKKGPVGTPGERGVKGDMGDKGEPGASDTWMPEFRELRMRITDLEDQLTSKIGKTNLSVAYYKDIFIIKWMVLDNYSKNSIRIATFFHLLLYLYAFEKHCKCRFSESLKLQLHNFLQISE